MKLKKETLNKINNIIETAPYVIMLSLVFGMLIYDLIF